MNALALIASLALPALANAQLVDPSFESPTSPGGTPFPVGAWSFDNSASVLAENSITPAHLARMLKFQYTSTGSAASGLSVSDVVQIVDLTVAPYAAMIAAGTASANASILFNRVAQDPTGAVDTAFSLRLWTFSNLGNAQSLNTPTSTAINPYISDDFLNTWEQRTLSIPLPVGTQYLAFYITANENSFNDTTGPREFHGHYADDAQLTITPAPSAAALLGLGALFSSRRRREGLMPRCLMP